MVYLMLYDTGMKAARGPLDRLAVCPQAPVTDMGGTLDPAAQAGNRQAAFPAAFGFAVQNGNFGVDKYGEGGGVIEPFVFRQAGVGAFARGLEYHQPQRHMHLGGGQSGPIGVHHGFHHVIDQALNFRRLGIGNRGGDLAQNGMAHAGDFQDHDLKYGAAAGAGQSLKSVNRRGWTGQKPSVINRAFQFGALALQIIVRDNNIDQALKALKKKMQREGIFREMKLRGAYEKPSEKRARERAEAVRRYRKLQRKRAQREGLIPMSKPKT
jgi:small subunit ribosomal protein S21